MTDNTQGLEDMSKPTVVDILAVIYLAGIENGLGRQLTNYDEIRHRKEAFINGNPALQEALAQLQSLIERSKLEARESTRKLYDKELKMHRDFMTNVLARENLKTDKTMSICDVCLTQLQFQRDKLRMEGNK